MSGAITLIGNVNIDLVMGSLVPWPAPGTESILSMSEWRVGGASGNSALALDALGAGYRLVANRGDDDFGQWLVKPFGRKADRWTVSRAATGLSVGVTHPDGERTFFTALGHLLEFSLDDVVAQLPFKARPGEVALLSGVFILPTLARRYGELIAILRQRGFTVALDTGWPDGGWTDDLRASALAWCAQTDLVLVNEAEARGMAGLSEAAIDAVAAAIREGHAGDLTLVIKRGADGAIVWHGQERHECRAAAVRVIDTIGAGDVFNAGFLVGRDGGLASALSLAVETASLAISTQPRRYAGGPTGQGHPGARRQTAAS